MSMSPVFVEIKASISEFQAKMGEAAAEIEHLSRKGSTSFAKLQTVGKGALLGVAGVALAVGAGSIEMADKFEVAHAKLEASLAALHVPFDSVQGRVASVDRAMEHLGFTNADTEEAIANMTTATGSSTKALSEVGLAADLARFSHTSLADASTAVAKAMAGNLRPLKAMGVDMPVAASSALKLANAHTALEKAQAKVNDVLARFPDAANKASKAHDKYLTAVAGVDNAQHKLNDTQAASGKIMDLLAKRLAGQAATAADTFQGKVGVLKAQMEDLGKNLGLVLIPLLESLGEKVMVVVGFFERHTTTAEILAGVIGGALAIAITAYIAGLVIAAATTLASVAAITAGTVTMGVAIAGVYVSMAAESIGAFMGMAVEALAWAGTMLVAGATALLPFLPIIAILAAVGVAAYLLYTNWDTVWSAIKTATSAAWTFLKSVFGFIVDLGLAVIKAYIGVLSAEWNLAWAAIHAAVTGAWSIIRPILDAVVSIGLAVIKREISGFQTTWNTVWAAVHGAVSAAWSIIKPIIDAITGAISTVSSAISGLSSAASSISNVAGTVGKVAGAVGGALSHIPGFADGVSNFGGGLAIVGENGPELAYLPQGTTVVPARQTANLLRGGGTSGRAASSPAAAPVDTSGIEHRLDALIAHVGRMTDQLVVARRTA